MEGSRNVYTAVAFLGALLCLHRVPAAESGSFKPKPEAPAGRGVDAPNAIASGYGLNEDPRMNHERPTLRVPLTDSQPVVDGKLDEPFWKDAARTGPLEVTRGEPAKSTTEAFILRDSENLYVGVCCAGKDATDGMDPRHTSSFMPGRIAEYAKSEIDKLLAAHWAGKPVEPAKEVEFVELSIDSNGDGNSYYLIRIAPEDGGKLVCSYNEHTPPWRDPTWRPPLKSAVARGTGAWAVEFALPLDIFNKNKTLASEMAFNIRRSGTPGGETHCWGGASANLDEWGILAGFPARESLPKPEYSSPFRHYNVPPKAKRSLSTHSQVSA